MTPPFSMYRCVLYLSEVINAVHSFQNNSSCSSILFPVLYQTGADIAVAHTTLIVLSTVEQGTTILHLCRRNTPCMTARILIRFQQTLAVRYLLNLIHIHAPFCSLLYEHTQKKSM